MREISSEIESVEVKREREEAREREIWRVAARERINEREAYG